MTRSSSSTNNDLYKALRQTLADLYNPTSAIPAIVTNALGYRDGERSDDIRTELIRVIQAMRPGPGIPEESRLWRLYRILSLRYIQHRTQAECAERLGLTVRHLAREQNDAIRLLASILQMDAEGVKQAPEQEVDYGSVLAKEMHVGQQSHLGAELESLAMHAPGAVTDVRAEVIAMMPMLRQIAETSGVTLGLRSPRTHVLAALHRSVFRQVLIGAFYYLIKQMQTGHLDLHLSIANHGDVSMVLFAKPIHAVAPSADWTPGVLVLSSRGDWAWQGQGQTATVEITLPSRIKYTVLVVDDNDDLQHYYRLCLEGSSFDTVSVSEGADVFEAIRDVAPAVILLDIMLPDVDGWELLRELQSQEDSKHIPVIICSVIREKDLGRAMGAGMYLTKPVLREDLLDALRRCLDLT